MRRWAVCLLLLVTSCGTDVVTCNDDARCLRAGRLGRCLASTVTARRFCAFADPRCPSGFRWDKTAGDGVAGQCSVSAVGSNGTDGGTADLSPPLDLAPPLQINGSTCAVATQCRSGFCIDGYCCDRDCQGDACLACNVAGHRGACTPIAAGNAPASGHASCGLAPKGSCGKDGTCDGKGACRLWPNGTLCGTSSCDGNSNTTKPPPVCDGQGKCVPSPTVTCSPYRCRDEQSCFDSCTRDSQCSGSNSCNMGSCGPKVNGSACGSNAECRSNFCVDEVCCNSECSGQCQACDLAGSLGTCGTVMTGPPHGARPPCGGSSLASNICAGQCDGSSATSCRYPTVQCRAPSCSDASTATLPASCDGTGYCPAVQTQSCGAFICSGAACLTRCASAKDCAAGEAVDYCQDGACTKRLPRGASCTSSEQCGLGIEHCCCDRGSGSPTCSSQDSCASGMCR